jgi:HlyD family secretion protein
MSVKSRIIIASVAIVAIAAVCFFVLLKKEKPVLWRTAPVEQGDLIVQVTAGGTLNAHENVLVGTQVSGTVSKLFADYNSKVKKGQVIALLDSTLLYASLLDSRATCGKAEAQMNLTNKNCLRTRALFARGLVAQADIDQAISDSASAAATLSSARAQLERAKINLRYATIVSPITGVVIGRNVDVGQTVAASFNTPTLFSIADDLSKMQVQASIDEADIGQIKVGQTATFTVDAFATRTFTGAVAQIRLQPTTVQNVVSYTVMIDVENSDMSLLPGMTANVTIEVKKASNVLKVPTAALKFMPPNASGEKGRRRGAAAGAGSLAGRQLSMGAPESGARKMQGRGFGRGNGADTGSVGPGQLKSKPTDDRGHVFLFTAEKKPKFVRVKQGLTNGGFTEVEGELRPGDLVIVGTVANEKSKAPAAQPLGVGGPPGMGRRF